MHIYITYCLFLALKTVLTEQKVPTHYKYSVVYYHHDTPGPPPLLPLAPGPHSHYNHTITVRGVTRQGHLEKQELLYIMLSPADPFNTCLLHLSQVLS